MTLLFLSHLIKPCNLILSQGENNEKSISRFRTNELVNTTKTPDVFLCNFQSLEHGAGKEWKFIRLSENSTNIIINKRYSCSAVFAVWLLEKLLKLKIYCKLMVPCVLICILMGNFSVFRYAVLIMFAFMPSHAKCFS